MFKSFAGNSRDLFLVAWILIILLILFSPIPPVLLDLFIIVNFGFGLTILLLTFYVNKPVAFSTFPSLLLVATLYRLSLNVAATRLILTQASAGKVIGAIGAFAVQGSFVVGLVVFFILVVVQYIVVTSGAQRVSEVSARFVLDSLPGQQMSIDADLNMGLIDQNEAKRRRKDLEKEAAFYGAMDGASKFVKGDAIAGIIILLINIFAGWVIGVAQLGMDWMTALQTYTLLTIGDGIVTQVPALIISVATGIIVTRSAADGKLSDEVLAQLTSTPKILAIVVAGLLGVLALPGMPKWPILVVLAAGCGVWLLWRRQAAAARDTAIIDPGTDSSRSEPAKALPAIEIQIGRNLGNAWQPLRPLIGERIASLRTQRESATGFSFPAVSLNESTTLSATEYEILLHGARHGKGSILPERTLAIRTSKVRAPIDGIETRDPAFGIPGVWIENTMRDRAQEMGYSLVDPVTVLITHLGEVLRTQAALLLSRSDVLGVLEGVRTRQPGLLEELTPAIMTVSDLQRILQNLLAEDVSIQNIDLICETLVDVGRNTKSHVELTELVRQRLSHAICHGLRGGRDQLAVLSLNPRVEAQIAETLRRATVPNTLPFEPRFAEQLLRAILPMAEAMLQQSLTPVLLCGPEIRRHLRAFTQRAMPRLAVLSVTEVPTTVDLSSFGVVSVD